MCFNGLGRGSKAIGRVKSGLAKTNRKSSRRVIVSLSEIPTRCSGVIVIIGVCRTMGEGRRFKVVRGTFVHLISTEGGGRVYGCGLARGCSNVATVVFKRVCECGNR